MYTKTQQFARRYLQEFVRRSSKKDASEVRKLRDQAWIGYFKNVCESIGAKTEKESKILESKKETMLDKNTC
jgi:hypothetical protein